MLVTFKTHFSSEEPGADGWNLNEKQYRLKCSAIRSNNFEMLCLKCGYIQIQERKNESHISVVKIFVFLVYFGLLFVSLHESSTLIKK